MAGGGPAGAVAALAMGRAGLRVALFAWQRPGLHRYGETLPPEVNPLLTDLSLTKVFMELDPVPSPGILSVWGRNEPTERDFIFNPDGFGWHVDRRAFDGMLREAAAQERNVALLHARVGSVQRTRSGWAVHSADLGPGRLEAELLLDASGRPGLAIDDPPARKIDDSLVAIILRVRRTGPAAEDFRTLIEAAPEGWWYSAAIPGHESVAMFFSDRQALRLRPQEASHLAQAPLTAGRIKGRRLVERRIVGVQSSIRRRISGSAWLAVGDAAASFDPLSGMGLLSAMSQGLSAAGSAARYLSSREDALQDAAAACRSVFSNYLGERRRYYAEERRFQDSGFWTRRVKRQAA